MGMYYCENCDAYHDNDWIPCAEHNGNLVCEESLEVEDDSRWADVLLVLLVIAVVIHASFDGYYNFVQDVKHAYHTYTQSGGDEQW